MTQLHKINCTKAKKLIQKGAVLVDVRDPVKFRDGTIIGAVNITIRQISTLMKYPRTTKIIFFGCADDDNDITVSASYATQLGFQDIYSLGNKDNWQN